MGLDEVKRKYEKAKKKYEDAEKKRADARDMWLKSGKKSGELELSCISAERKYYRMERKYLDAKGDYIDMMLDAQDEM